MIVFVSITIAALVAVTSFRWHSRRSGINL